MARKYRLSFFDSAKTCPKLGSLEGNDEVLELLEDRPSGVLIRRGECLVSVQSGTVLEMPEVTEFVSVSETAREFWLVSLGEFCVRDELAVAGVLLFSVWLGTIVRYSRLTSF